VAQLGSAGRAGRRSAACERCHRVDAGWGPFLKDRLALEGAQCRQIPRKALLQQSCRYLRAAAAREGQEGAAVVAEAVAAEHIVGAAGLVLRLPLPVRHCSALKLRTGVTGVTATVTVVAEARHWVGRGPLLACLQWSVCCG
jgi:hypothetical protein